VVRSTYAQGIGDLSAWYPVGRFVLSLSNLHPGTLEVGLEEELPRGVRRSRRQRAVRAHTISVKRLSHRELTLARALYPEAARRRLPVVRDDCVDGERPCPFVSCRHHLFLDVSPATGAIKINFPDLCDADGGIRFEEMPETCALDVADRGGATSDRVAVMTNLTRERVRQIEASASAVLIERLRGFLERA
jgi:hypothetical protein